MRPLLAIAIAVAVLGGVKLYMVQRKAAPRVEVSDEKEAQGIFSLEMTLPFDAQPDTTFSVRGVAVLVQMNGRDLLRLTEPVSAGTPLVVDRIAGVDAGQNELYVEVMPAVEQRFVANAVRVRVRQDGRTIAEESLWGEPAQPVAGRVLFSPIATDTEAHGDDEL